MGVCVCLLFIISQWSWWLYWERWPSRQGPADHWPAGRTSSSQHWWLTGDKKKEHWEQKKKWKYILLSQSGYNTPSELQTNTHTKTYWSVFSALSCISVRTHPLPQISLEVKNNWAKGLSHTHPAAFSLHGDDDPARLSCLRLPPPTHV